MIRDGQLRFLAGHRLDWQTLTFDRKFPKKNIHGDPITVPHQIHYHFKGERHGKLLFEPVLDAYATREGYLPLEITKDELLEILEDEKAYNGVRVMKKNSLQIQGEATGFNRIVQSRIKKTGEKREDIEIKYHKTSIPGAKLLGYVDHVTFSNIDGFNDKRLVRHDPESAIYIKLPVVGWAKCGLDSIEQESGSQTKFFFKSRGDDTDFDVGLTEKDLLEKAKNGDIALDNQGLKLIRGEKSDSAKYEMYDDEYDYYEDEETNDYDYDRELFRLMRLAKE